MQDDDTVNAISILPHHQRVADDDHATVRVCTVAENPGPFSYY
jgi:hypothetical protein